MDSRFLIYGLIDPRSGELRYVGQTSRDLEVRYREHLRYVSRGIKRHVYWWIRSLQKLGLEPERFVIDSFDEEVECLDAERFFIAYFGALGCRLTNDTVGGEGSPGYKHTEDARRKMSIARLGKPPPMAAIRGMVEATRGVPRTPEVRRKVSRARGGRPVVDEAGFVYLSARDAAVRLGVDPSNAAKAIKKGYRVGGHALRYLEGEVDAAA